MPFAAHAADDVSPEELRHRLAGMQRLLDVTRVLAAEIDLNMILQEIAVEACVALDCERASVYQYDPKREELYTRVATELEIAEIRKGLQHGISGHVARTRTVANVPDPPRDPRWDSTIDRATGFHTRNILAAPLTSPHDDRLLGVLQLLNKRDGLFDAFDEDLLLAFSQHAAVALDRARLVDELRENQVVEASLNVARKIQQGFMPTRMPDTPGYELATWWFPNQAVGGDYCDCMPLRDGRTGLVIADVSGHGLGPSLLMASVRAALRALMLEHSSPEALLNLLARALAPDLQYGRFITMALAALDPQTHTVRFANAGHAPVLHFCRESGTFQSLDATGVPLGVDDQPDYPQGPPIAMHVGDLLFLCTDGIIEATDSAHEQFGYERLQRIIRDRCDEPVGDIVRAVGRQVESHYEGDSPPDDLTILAARRNG
jgi:serine phosphatase RsbU (regulator of sigma subunit)